MNRGQTRTFQQNIYTISMGPWVSAPVRGCKNMTMISTVYSRVNPSRLLNWNSRCPTALVIVGDESHGIDLVTGSRGAGTVQEVLSHPTLGGHRTFPTQKAYLGVPVRALFLIISRIQV